MNLRGKFTTDADGRFSFRSVKPAGYPIPINGPVGDLLKAQGRHNMRPAHLHFLIYKPGYKTHISQVYLPDDPNIETDVQFGVTRRLLGDYVRHENEKPPAPGVKDPWYSLDYTFFMEPGTARLPRAPIQDKAKTTEMRPQYLRGREPRARRWRSSDAALTKNCPALECKWRPIRAGTKQTIAKSAPTSPSKRAIGERIQRVSRTRRFVQRALSGACERTPEPMRRPQRCPTSSSRSRTDRSSRRSCIRAATGSAAWRRLELLEVVRLDVLELGQHLPRL